MNKLLTSLSILCISFLISGCMFKAPTLDYQRLLDSNVVTYNSVQEAVKNSDAENLEIDPRELDAVIWISNPAIIENGVINNFILHSITLEQGQTYQLNVRSQCVACIGFSKVKSILYPQTYVTDQNGEIIETINDYMAADNTYSGSITFEAPYSGEYKLLISAENSHLANKTVSPYPYPISPEGYMFFNIVEIN